MTEDAKRTAWRGGPEARSRWLLHAGAGSDPLLDGATQAEARFRQPTAVSD